MSKPIEFLGRHLVAICVTYRRNVDEDSVPDRFVAFAGCLIDVLGTVWIITAGHIVKELENLYDEDENTIRSCVIADSFGPSLTDSHPIPFDFQGSDRHYIDDDDLGLDFGMILLREYYLRLIMKNGIVVLDENAWKMSNDVKPDHHFVLGFPEEFTSSHVREGEDGLVAPTLLRVRKVNVEASDRQTTYPRFIAEVADNPLSTLRGMSGGPIFAFDSRKLDRYWIVAIQSAWNSRRRRVFGCSLSVVGSLIYKWADEVLSNISSGSGKN